MGSGCMLHMKTLTKLFSRFSTLFLKNKLSIGYACKHRRTLQNMVNLSSKRESHCCSQLIEIPVYVLANIWLISVKHTIFMGLNRNKMKEMLI